MALGIKSFVDSLRDYKYCPPSDNLWTISIKEHNSGEVSTQTSDSSKKDNWNIVSLYNNILTVNSSWSKSTFSHKWGINFPQDYYTGEGELQNNIANNYLSSFADESGVFLASDVNISTFENQIDQTVGQELLVHGGFLNMGRVFAGRTYPNTCNISFLVSNWSIVDILIEPWMIAISQRGLIEYSDNALGVDKSIRADIFIRQYSASSPSSPQKLILRKEIILYNAFPQKRGNIELDYTPESAGKFRKEIVSFQFDEHSINYKDTTGDSIQEETPIVMANDPMMNANKINNFA